MDYIKEKLYQQLAIDYCSQISDIKDDKNHFMKVLVTGFDPFGGENVNPAYEAVKLLPDIIEGAQIIKLEIPTVFKKSIEIVKEAVEKDQPDVVINVGQAGGRACVTVEKVAINLADAGIPDNAGDSPEDESLEKDGPDAYFSTLPVKAMVENVLVIFLFLAFFAY